MNRIVKLLFVLTIGILSANCSASAQFFGFWKVTYGYSHSPNSYLDTIVNPSPFKGDFRLDFVDSERRSSDGSLYSSSRDYCTWYSPFEMKVQRMGGGRVGSYLFNSQGQLLEYAQGEFGKSNLNDTLLYEYYTYDAQGRMTKAYHLDMDLMPDTRPFMWTYSYTSSGRLESRCWYDEKGYLKLYPADSTGHSYDDQDLLTTITRYNRSDTSRYYLYQRTSFRYNSDKQRIYSRSESFLPKPNTWFPNNETYSYYSPEGRLDSTFYRNFSNIDEYLYGNIYRYYNDQGQLIETIQKKYLQSGQINKSRSRYIYDSQGRIFESISASFKENRFVDNSKTRTIWSADNRERTIVHFRIVDSIWQQLTFSKHLWDAEGRLLDEEQFLVRPDGSFESSYPEGRGKNSYKWDENGCLIEFKHYNDYPESPDHLPNIRMTFHWMDSFSLGMSQKMNYKELTVFPIPCKEYLFIQIPELTGGPLELQVMDYSGRTHKSLSINASGSTVQLSTSELKNGIYLLIVNQMGATWTKSFIKN